MKTMMHEDKWKKPLQQWKTEREQIESDGNGPAQLRVAESRYHRAQQIYDRCVREGQNPKRTLTDRIDSVVCHRIIGPIILAFSLYAVYELAIVQGYNLSNLWWPFLGEIKDALTGLLPHEGFMIDPFMTSLVSWVLQGVFSVLIYIPIFIILFAIIAVMEDSGYMARVAFILDRVFRPFGLHGQSALPLILAGLYIGGCAIPGVMATKVIKDRKARLATILIIPLMNCMAKIPFFTLMVGLFFSKQAGLMMFMIATFTIFLGLTISRVLSGTVLKKMEVAPFIMELPAYHLPSLRNVLTRVVERTWGFIRKVVTIVALVMVVLFFLLNFPALKSEQTRQYLDQAEESYARFASKLEVLPGYALDFPNLESVADYLDYESRFKKAIRDTKANFYNTTHQKYFTENPTFYLVAQKGTIPMESEQSQALLDAIRGIEYELALYLPTVPLNERDAFLSLFIKQFDRSEDTKVIKSLIWRGVEKSKAGLYVREASKISDALREITRDRKVVRKDYRESLLTGSFLGTIGRWLEPITRFAGFDWHINVGLISSFAAKENAVATLGSIFQGELQSDTIDGLGLGWNSLHGISMILFMILYPPCLATILTISAQVGWKWALLSIIYPICIGFALSVLVFSVGTATGIGGLGMFAIFYGFFAFTTFFIGFTHWNRAKRKSLAPSGFEG
jgi:ferrous iron transport protein B